MKIIHTSDWHLGQSFFNYDRTAEQRDMLRQMEELVREQQPDLFLLSGDVFDVAQPSAAAATLFSDALYAIHQACPEMTIVVTAGNHDSRTRHEVFRRPWRELGVHAIGTLHRDTWEDHIIEVPGKGYVIALPYSGIESLPDFVQKLLDAVAERNSADLPVILMAHTTVQGGDFAGHTQSSDKVVGYIEAIPLSELGEGYDYLALGHIHKPQFVHSGRHNVRYSGSPIAVSFDETYDHSVSLVEIAHRGDRPVVTELPIDNIHPLVTLPTEGAATWDEAKRLLEDYPADIPAYIRLSVLVEDFIPEAASAEAERLTKGKACRFCYINPKRLGTERETERPTLTLQEFRKVDPEEVALHFLWEETGQDPDEEVTALFREVVKMVHEEESE